MIPPQSPCVLDSDKYRCNETDRDMKLMIEFRRMSIMSEALVSSPPRRRTHTKCFATSAIAVSRRSTRQACSEASGTQTRSGAANDSGTTVG